MRENKSLVPVDQVEKNRGRIRGKRYGRKTYANYYQNVKKFKRMFGPDRLIGEYGADACRLYIMFMGPLEILKHGIPQGLVGLLSLLERCGR